MSTRTTSGFSEIPRDAAPSFSSSSTYRRHPLLFWVGGIFATLIAALFIASFFLDDMIRVRTQVVMNQKLKGYHVALAHAHLQLVGGILTLNGLKVIQQAHPHPAIADVRMMRFHIQVKELFSRRVVADVLLSHPRVHIESDAFGGGKERQGPAQAEGLAGRAPRPPTRLRSTVSLSMTAMLSISRMR